MLFTAVPALRWRGLFKEGADIAGIGSDGRETPGAARHDTHVSAAPSRANLAISGAAGGGDGAGAECHAHAPHRVRGGACLRRDLRQRQPGLGRGAGDLVHQHGPRDAAPAIRRHRVA